MRSANLVRAAIVALALVSLAGFVTAQSKSAAKIPTFKYDGAWPKLPLPNQWTFEGITGLTVDKDDLGVVIERPGYLDQDPATHRKETTENFAARNPPTAMCCKKPPAVLAFDQAGNLVQHWDVENQNGLHLILADKAGNIWVGTDSMRKFSKDGKLLAAIQRASEPVGQIKAGQYPGDTPMI